ncbi:MAG TPA: class I SAM-dependent methyltransferase [Xanthobacteraceae bacterium]
MTEAFHYSGHEELEQLLLMPGYNRHIADLCLAAISPGQTLVDFGAGTGTISALVRERAKAAKIWCAEIDAANIAALEKQGFDVITDIAKLQPDTVDVIYSSNVLEHIEDDVAKLKQLRACLKPGGRAVFWVPAFQCLWTAMDDRVEHRRRYTRATLEDAFRRAGFDVERCFYQDSLGFFVALLFKTIGRRDGRLSNTPLRIYDRLVFPLSRLCDRVCSQIFGKNAVIYARKKATGAA